MGCCKGKGKCEGPKDDARTINDIMNDKLAPYYASQFVQNEMSTGKLLTDVMTENETVLTDVNASSHVLEHTPVLRGTITGFVHVGTTLVQTFTQDIHGLFNFKFVGTPDFYVTKANCNFTTGEIVLFWNKLPADNVRLVASYEYNMDISPKPRNDFEALVEGYDCWPGAQFVQNEDSEGEFLDDILNEDETEAIASQHYLENSPVEAGTLTGYVYVGLDAVQTFVVNTNGLFTFQPVGTPDVYAIGGTFNVENGEIILFWNKRDLYVKLKASYEFYPSKSEPVPDSPWVKPTFETFLTAKELNLIYKMAGTIACWDFATSLGDTIREKYESLYVKLVEINNVLIRKGAKGYFWIVTTPEVASIFETATVAFESCTQEEWRRDTQGDMVGGVFPGGVPCISYRGSINKKWRIYSRTDMQQGQILMGCNDKLEDFKHYCRMSIANFVI